MAEVAFGIFDHIERRDERLSELYEGRLRLLEAADAAGFFCYHLAEHHGTPLGMAPSPGIFIAAAAARTRRIHLGPLVYLLPLYNPLRLAEEICMLDHLSGGRLEVGVGRGVSPFELAHFNVPFLESREIFEEALDLIVAALRNERVSHRGERYRVRDYPIAVRPMQQPNPPFWYVSRSAQTFRAAWQEHHRCATSINPRTAEPKVGAVRHCYVSVNDADALAVARPAYKVYFNNIQKLWRDFYTVETHFTDDLNIARRHQAAIVGSPAAVADEIARFFEQSGCNYLVLSFAWGGLTQAQSEGSLDLFASKVMPHFTVGAAASADMSGARVTSDG